jgi:hypothetical protein
MLGKDADRNEYWFFKEEPAKLFIKKFEEVKKDLALMEIDENQDHIDIPEIVEPKFQWFFYDEEDELDKLVEGCNTKGIRERKLQENLRKIKDRMKLKKGKGKPKADETAAQNKEEEKDKEVEQINTESQDSSNQD